MSRLSGAVQEDLLVHKQKVVELERALHLLLQPPTSAREARAPGVPGAPAAHGMSVRCPLLLVTGPSGSGKASCLHLLATEMGVQVIEWRDVPSLRTEPFHRALHDSRDATDAPDDSHTRMS